MKKTFLSLLSAATFLLGGTLWADNEATLNESDCGIQNIPYLETFDNDSWTDNNTLNCWTIIDNNTDNSTWTKDASSGVGKSGCARFKYHSSNVGDDYLISPQINISQQASLSFKIKTGNYPEKYSVLLSTTGKSVEDFSNVLQAEQEIKQTEYQTISIDLSDYVGQQVYIAIKASSAMNQYYMYVDDFMVVSCGAPAGITAERVSAANYKIAWNTSAAQSELSYKKTSDSEFSTVFLTANEYTLSTWEENTQYTLRLRAICGAGDTSLYSDAFTFTTGYQCEAPSGIAVEKKENGYELRWTNFAEKTVVYYKKSDEADFTSVEATGQTYLFTDLQAGSLYAVKLRSVCGAADTSLYSAEYTFTTECGMATIPYLETFESDHWITKNALLCWTIIDGNNDKTVWEQNTANGVDGGGCARYGYSTSNNADDYLVSPQINLNRNAALSFKIKTGSGSEKYSVLLSKTGKAIEDFTETLRAETEISTSVYETVDIDLSAYTGEMVYIAIKVSSIKNQWNVFVDDFMVVSCGAPSDVALVEVAETSVKVDFVSPAANFVVAYKKASESTWTEINASAKPVQISNLDPGYTYEVKVKALCSADDESLFSNIATFTTPCFPLEFPLIEDFSTALSIPICWDSTQWQGYNGAWHIYKRFDGNYLEFAGGNSSWGKISTPDVDLTGTIDMERLEMAMTYDFSNYDTKGERLWISYSTDKGLTWDTIMELDKNNKREELSIKLGEYVNGASTIRMRLESIGKNSSGFSIKVYDFKIRQAPICFPPTNLRTEDEIMYNTATLVWTKPDSSHDGAIKNYSVVYGDIESTKTVVASDTMITLDDLVQHTQYEARVSTVCQTESSEAVKITWETPYSCLKVDDLKVGALLPTSAELSWSSKHEMFEIRYRMESDNDWTVIENISTKNYTLQNLVPAAQYTIKVRAVCGSDDASLWDSISLLMPHGVVPLPYAEKFEQTKDSLPAWWRYSKMAGSSTNMQWIIKTDKVKEGTKALAYNSTSLPSGNIAVVSTPLLDFSYDAVYTLDFWVYRPSYYSKKDDRLRIFVGQSPFDTLGAHFVKVIYRDIEKEPIEQTKAEDDWYHYSIELKNIEGYRYVLLCGVSEYGNSIYVDDFKVDALYETNLGIVDVAPIVPRADLDKETVRVSLNNTGLDDFSGNASLCFSVDGKDTVRENVSFAEEPLAPETDRFEYTFNAKADFSSIGTHKLSVWVEAQGDPAFDNAAVIDVLHYAPVELPYNTYFCDSIEQEKYIYAMNLNEDDFVWTRAADSGMYLAPNANLDANDIFFTPGIEMPIGIYEIELAYGTATEGKTEAMQLALVRGFDTLGGMEVVSLNAITQTDTSLVQELVLDEAGIYMLRFTAKSEKDQGGINVFALNVKNTLSYVNLAEAICQGGVYPFGGKDLTEAGTYTDTIRHEEGTDTIFTLVLSVNSVYGFTLDTTVCQGQSVEFGGRTYTESGEFKAEYKTVNGCDSIYSIKLTVNPKAAAPVVSGKAVEGKKQWVLTASTQESTVQWYRDDAEIENADSVVYLAEQEGIYHATATNDCGTSEASNKIEVKFSVANEGADMAQAPSVYPNPARETVYVKASESIKRVVIYAPNGKAVKKSAGSHSGMLTLSVGDLNAGIYVMQVMTASGTYNYKLVVNE